MSNKWQKIGTGLIISALVLLFLKLFLICYILLAGVLGIYLYLVRKEEKTITQWFRSKFPKSVDKILTIALIVVFMIMDLKFGLFFLIGTINGHLNGDW